MDIHRSIDYSHWEIFERRKGKAMSYSNIGKGIMSLIDALMWLALITVPLAIWKIIDIIIWLFHHFEIGWKP